VTGRLLGAVTVLAACAGVWSLYVSPAVPDAPIARDEQALERGRYLVHAGGCISCHEGRDGRPGLSGGHALKTPFGTFYASNITPDARTGIGGWSGADFLRALKHGRRPDGSFYYPAFPYRAYSGTREADALDMAAWLMAQEPVAHEVNAHEIPAWMGRWMMALWNRLADFLEPAPPLPEDPLLHRGAYLARHLGHCGECHTPRNGLGILRHELRYAGAELGDDTVPAIDPEALAGWSEEDFALFLFLGLTPEDEYVGGEMGEVIEHGTAHLRDSDREALAAYFIRGQ